MKPYSIIIIILLDFITKNFANNRIRVFLAWPFHNHLCTAIVLLSNQLCYFLLMYVIVALLIDIIVLVYNYPALWVQVHPPPYSLPLCLCSFDPLRRVILFCEIDAVLCSLYESIIILDQVNFAVKCCW